MPVEARTSPTNLPPRAGSDASARDSATPAFNNTFHWQRATMPLTDAIHVLRDFERALAFAHDEDVAHRDTSRTIFSGPAAPRSSPTSESRKHTLLAHGGRHGLDDDHAGQRVDRHSGRQPPE